MKYDHIVISICISLIANDVQYLSMCLLAICSSLQKCLFGFTAIFNRVIGVFTKMAEVLYILNTSHLSEI